MTDTTLSPSTITRNGYELIDSGNGKKLERFGSYIIERPCSQAVWKPSLPPEEWRQRAHASFSREAKSGWKFLKKPLPEEWHIDLGIHKMALQTTDFGHLGIFPEQIKQWRNIHSILQEAGKKRTLENPIRVLNLFAYSGGSTLAAATAGASVCHLDASKGMVDWARKNSSLNQLEKNPIRWIVEDVMRFCAREEKRGSLYDAIILDPPSFGRGSNGEVFKIEDEVHVLLKQVVRLLTPKPLFILFSCHTPGFTPTTMGYLLEDVLIHNKQSIERGEMLLETALDSENRKHSRPIPSGTYALWTNFSTP